MGRAVLADSEQRIQEAITGLQQAPPEIGGEDALVARSRNHAVECAVDAATLIREDRVAEARDLLGAALVYLDQMEQRRAER